MWGAVIGDMTGSSFVGKVNKDHRFEISENMSEPSENTALIAALEELLIYGMKPAQGRIERALAAREIGLQQKKYLLRYFSETDAVPTKWLSRSGLDKCTAAACFSPILSLPFAFAYDNVETVLSQSELTCAYISCCDESREAAKAAAVIVYSLLHGIEKDELNDICEPFCGFLPLGMSYDEAQEELSAGGTLRQAVMGAAAAFGQSDDYESAVRYAVALGGRPRTVCTLAGAMAQAYYKKIPDHLIEMAADRLAAGQKNVIEKFPVKKI